MGTQTQGETVATQEAAGIDVRRLFAVLRRNIVIIVPLTVVLGLLGYGYAQMQTPMYEAGALLLYEPQIDISDPQGNADPNMMRLQLQSAVTILRGPEIRNRSRQELGNSDSLPPYTVTAEISSSDVASDDGSGNGVAVIVDSPDPEFSADAANAYADAFVAYRIKQEQDRIERAQRAIEEKLTEFTTPEQRLSSDYVYLRERLSDLGILSATATGNFTVALPATTPSAPYAPQPMRSAVMGGLVGFVLGVGIAFLREKIDTSVRGYRDVTEITGLPVIGRIPVIPQAALEKGPIVVVSEADGRGAESLRMLRSNLEFASLGEEKRVIMVVSAQKGEGKSLVTANLAASLALAGKKVVLMDADLRRPRIHALFRVRNQAGVSSVIAGHVNLDEAIQTVDPLGKAAVRTWGDGLRPATDDRSLGAGASLTLLTSGPMPPNPGEMVASRRFTELVQELAAMPFDYVLIDSPAFMPVGDATALSGNVDAVILLVNLKMAKRPALEETRDFLAPLPATKLGVVVTMDSSGKNERYHYYAAT
jgi:Mrp family chromosome partitioning ATPase/capsular polysaccharide biosynthesis protein